MTASQDEAQEAQIIRQRTPIELAQMERATVSNLLLLLPTQSLLLLLLLLFLFSLPPLLLRYGYIYSLANDERLQYCLISLVVAL